MAQTILITGANRGIGLAMARLAAARGDTVLATARHPEATAELAKLRATGGDVTSFALDVTDPARAADLAHILDDRAIDLVVCNAGALEGRGGLADRDYTRDAFERVLMVNIAGPFFTVRAFLPHLTRRGGKTALTRGGGKVAVISSTMGSSSRPKGDGYLYRASKAAATNLAMNLAVELKPLGVAVGAYHPGWVRTDMGGAGADITPQESAAGLLARFDALSLATTGVLEDYLGQPLAF
ncbi:MAG: short-chain dehydrogenase [Alphaproteobacteria bacterium HGW-Alphaproteobacteria-8]|nr:MAG: short-chain dehydrogenase [Alphaproteobacteria bacterium HGW-Alphaproteobacteria-8]